MKRNKKLVADIGAARKLISRTRRVRGDSPSDIGDSAIRVYREGKKKYHYTLDDLYEWLLASGLSYEEAEEMTNLERDIESGEI